jgi:hypothetical protein
VRPTQVTIHSVNANPTNSRVAYIEKRQINILGLDACHHSASLGTVSAVEMAVSTLNSVPSEASIDRLAVFPLVLTHTRNDINAIFEIPLSGLLADLLTE